MKRIRNISDEDAPRPAAMTGSSNASTTAPTTTVPAETGIAAVSVRRSTRSKRRMPLSLASSAATMTASLGRSRRFR